MPAQRFSLWFRVALTYPWWRLDDGFASVEEATRIGKLCKKPGDYRVEPDGERPYHSARADWTVAELPSPKKKAHRAPPPDHYTIPEVRHLGTHS